MRAWTLALTAAALIAQAGRAPAVAEQHLTIQVSPRVAPAPGRLRVSARVEPSDDNRELEVAAVSDSYSRLSAIQLDGTQAPRVSVVDYSDLPAGTYEITVVLLGTHGRKAAETQFFEVVPMAGRR